MPIQFPDFQRISFDEANPFLTGMGKGQALAQNFMQFPQELLAKQLANQKQQAEQPYWQQSAAAELQKSLLANRNQDLVNKYYGRQAESTMGLQGAQAGNLSAEAAINRLKAQNPGLIGGDEAQNIALADMGGPNAELYKKLAQAKIALQQSQANYYNQGGAQLGVGAKEVRNFQTQLQNEYGIDEAKALQLANAMMSGQKTLPDGSPVPEPSTLDQESMNRIVKYGSSAQQLNQQGAAQQLDYLLDRGTELMPSASKFAGLAGKAGQTIDQYAASVGAQDPDYQSWLTFTTQIVPQAANQMLLTEGARANNTQKAMMMKVADPIIWNSNPKLAMSMWKYLTDTFKGKGGITSIAAKGVAQRRMELRNGTQESSNSSNQSELPGKAVKITRDANGNLVRAS